MATDPERRRRAEAVCYAALDRDPQERPTFIAAACHGDEALQREVEMLLVDTEPKEGFLTELVAAAAADFVGNAGMASLIGRQIGYCQILSRLGAGGMGEVYRAQDMQLGREVAVKVLPAIFAADRDRLRRFEREARFMAALNHPHIAAVYGLETVDRRPALILELVEGETLADRLARAPMTATEALPVAAQIADALGAAHDKGIVHRDLKPANVKVTSNGVVKVLDFGLAKAGNVTGQDLSQLPTVTISGRHEGALVGTVAYMSPEAARGEVVDKRTDIWAFGCVLYEMLARRRAFPGDDVSSVLAAVINKEPEWALLPADTSTAIRRLLRRCLEKDRRRRLADIADAQLDIAEALTTSRRDDADLIDQTFSTSGWRRILTWATVGALAGAAVVLAVWAPWRRVVPPGLTRASIELGADVSLAATQGAAAVLSPDGTVLAFVAQQNGGARHLYVRRLDQLEAVSLAGTDGARHPFFSPDGRWVAFFARGKLLKIAVTGGAAVALTNVANVDAAPLGGTWNQDDTIAFNANNLPGAPLFRISARGGSAQLLVVPLSGARQRWPQWLPGDKAILYTATDGNGDDPIASNIIVQPLSAGDRKVVVQNGFYGRYLASGHLVYMHEGILFAVPFDLNRLEVSGPAVPVLEGIANFPTTGSAQFSVSERGTLVYVPGPTNALTAPIDWVDRSGHTTSLRSSAANWSNPMFSPDGRQLAIDVSDGHQMNIWVYELARQTLSRLTYSNHDEKPVWTPDGQRIVFASSQAGRLNLYWRRADGTGAVQRLTESENAQYPVSWHPSGKFLAFYELRSTPKAPDEPLFRSMILPMQGDETTGWKPGSPSVLQPGGEEPVFSADGRWLAYLGGVRAPGLWVRPFPGPGGPWQVARAAGFSPTWSRVRQELFYGLNGQIMVAAYHVAGEAFRADEPRLWSDVRYLGRRERPFDLHPDGERFVFAPVPEDQPDAKRDHVTVILNFFEELHRIAPVKH